MKLAPKTIAILATVAVVIAFAVPADSQGEAEKPLDKQVKELTDLVAQQQMRIALLEKKVKEDGKAAERLLKAVASAEAKGFAFAAPNPDSKKALLDGLGAYAKAIKGTKPADDDSGDS